MTGVDEKEIKKVLGGLFAAAQDELKNLKQEELEQYWHFKWDDTKSLEFNVYQFNDLLGLYKSFCRRWEEMHNGSACVVERVRDTYLMPKINKFTEKFQQTVHWNG